MISLKATFIYLFIYLFIFNLLNLFIPLLVFSLLHYSLLNYSVVVSTFEYYSPNTPSNRKQASPPLFKTPTRYFLSREMIGDPPNL